MRLTTDQIAAATGGRRIGPDVEVVGVGIDTRVIHPGQLFVPVVGERDGHEFVDAAVAAGAPAYLWSRAPAVGAQRGGATVVVVPDTGRALLDLGRAVRSRIGDLVIGVTGSVGKTTVKDLTAAVLATTFRTAASEKSFNNELGVPLTLLNAPDDVEAAVVELGSRGRGHIALLCDVARPMIGVVTAVAMAHTERFGSIDDVAASKGELVEALPTDGTAVLNSDDPRVAAMADRTRGRVLRFGTGPLAEVRAVDVRVDDELRARFVVESEWGRADVHLGVRGEHQVGNALAAAATGLVAGVAADDMARGLAAEPASPWRMALATARSGALVLNDAYNANPASMAAALRALARLPARRRVAVLGLMAELGPAAEAEHRRIADLARALGVEIVAVGTPWYGVEPVPDGDGEAALAAVAELGEGDAVLVKGSRVAGLERVAAALLDPNVR
ncbi:MAG: UDP-N-acetylmuramoyl-tripeptide--D-alanyl-D-alanine ligase [Acidimicrobiales bacterium]